MKGGPLLARLTTAGRSGIFSVWWEADVGRHPASPWLAPTHTDSASLHMRVALPPIRINQTEFASMRAGDVLIMGTTVVNQPCRLATHTGWSIASAVIAEWTPHAIRITLGSLQPRPLEWALTPTIEAVALVYPLAGQLEVDLFQFTELFRSNGQPVELDLALTADAPVELYRGTVRIAQVEILTVDGEWGLRLLHRFPDPGATDES